MRFALTLSALMLGVYGSACSEAPSPKKAKGGRPAALVSVAKVRDGSISQRWSFLGEVRADARAEVAAGASGAVTQVTVREGDTIEKGKLLLEVDPALAAARTRVTKAEVDQVAERLAQAKRDLERIEGLSERAVSKAEVEQARSEVSALSSELAAREAAAQQARAEYIRHLVRAPFDGAVVARRVDVGDWVTPGQPVLELVSTGELDILVNVGQALLRSIAVGDTVTLDGPEPATATIVAFVPALDPVARTARVRLKPSDPPDWLIPGATVDVTFDVDAGEGGVVVPRDAVIEAQTGARLVKVVEGKAQNVSLRILARAPDAVLVLAEGLFVGDDVVIRGNERLRPGQEVRVASPDGAGDDEPGTTPMAAPGTGTAGPRGG